MSLPKHAVGDEPKFAILATETGSRRSCEDAYQHSEYRPDRKAESPRNHPRTRDSATDGIGADHQTLAYGDGSPGLETHFARAPGSIPEIGPRKTSCDPGSAKACSSPKDRIGYGSAAPLRRCSQAETCANLLQSCPPPRKIRCAEWRRRPVDRSTCMRKWSHRPSK